ncbi:MAG: helix-turn-helix domain-containing protein [Aerococcus sp.]|nr:helix-turn-helix domain-containing protein [Aerococcus sp.]
MKPRKTTFEERLRIVKDYLENHLSYREVAQKYQINYSRIYGWIKKYEEFGPDGLHDGRGKYKPESLPNDVDELTAKNQVLELHDKYLNMESDSHTRVRQAAAYRTIDQLKEIYPITWLCKTLNISRASYYKWYHRSEEGRS